MILRSVDDSQIKGNLVCEVSGANAVVLNPSGTGTFEVVRNPADFDPGNGGNQLKDNQFLGYAADTCGGFPGTAPDGICFVPPPAGQLNDQGNLLRDNTSSASGACAP